MTCSSRFNIKIEDPYLSFGTMFDDKIYYICSTLNCKQCYASVILLQVEKGFIF